MTDLVRAHADALAYLRGGGASATLNCGYGRGFSVLEVIEMVKRVSGVVRADGRVTPLTSWRLPTVSAPRSDGNRILTIWKPSSPMRWHGSASSHRAPPRANFARLESGRFPIPYQGARLPALIRFLERAMPKPYSSTCVPE